MDFYEEVLPVSNLYNHERHFIKEQQFLFNPYMVFLASLRSAGKLKYKRYTASPLRYAGGKSLAVGFITELLPPKVNRVVSPFLGGGSVEIAFANELRLQVIAYDVFDILCIYWKVQLANPKLLAEQLRGFAPDRNTFAQVKEHLKQYWKDEREMDQIEIASHYYFNSNTSYGPHFLGWALRCVS